MVTLPKAKQSKRTKAAARSKAPRKARAPRTRAEQPDLIPGVRPPNEKAIAQAAEALYLARCERVKAVKPFYEREATLREELTRLIRNAGYQPDDDGAIHFTVDGWEAGLEPQDEKVIAKPAKTPKAESDGDRRSGLGGVRRRRDV